MDKMNIVTIVYFLLLAIINFVVYSKLSAYLFLLAGVTKEDARRYTQRQGINAQARLTKWLRRRTKHPKEFNIMLAFCSVSVLMSFFCISGIMVTLNNGNSLTIKIFAAVIFVLSVLSTVFGFVYGRKIKQNFESDFSSAQYEPYDDEDEKDEVIYYKHKTPSSPEKKIFKRFLPYLLIGVLVILISIAAPKIDDYNHKIQSEYENQVSEVDKLTPYDVSCLLAEGGWNYYPSYEELTKRYPTYDLLKDTCISVNDTGMHFEFCTVSSKQEAEQIYKIIENEIDSLHRSDDSTEQIIQQDDYAFYCVESDSECAVVIRSAGRIIYSYCDAVNFEWLKSSLGTLGCLAEDEENEPSYLNTNGLGYIFGFAVLSVLSRISFNWLKNISYTISGQSLMSVEIHNDKVNYGEIPYEKELDWLVRVSQYPRLTRLFYILFYVFTSIAPICILLSIVDIFVARLDFYLGKAALVMIGVLIGSVAVGAILSNIAESKMKNKYR